MLGYSLGVAFDSASYLQTFKATNINLADTTWYGLVVLIIMACIAAKGEQLIFNIAGPMIVAKLGAVVALGAIMVPHWNFANIKAFPNFFEFIRDVILMLPFALYSILFVQILSPVNIAFRKMEKDPKIATYRSFRVNRVAFIFLVISVLFFALSFIFSLSYEQAKSAFDENISALAIAAKVLDGNLIKVTTALLNIFAMLTAFLDVYLGFQESPIGVARNSLSCMMPKDRINEKALFIGVTTFAILSLWIWLLLRMKVLIFVQLSAPVLAIVSCLIPTYLVYKIDMLKIS